MERCIIVHYGEIGLKGKNRATFEHTLIAHVGKRLQSPGKFTVRRISGRILVKATTDFDDGKIKAALKEVFGITSFLFAYMSSSDLAQVSRDLIGLLKNRSFETFCVRVRRGNKELPFSSMEAEKLLGSDILKVFPAKVKLENPDLTCHVDFVEKFSFIYFEKISGLGGLPVTSSGKLIALISAGFDSPIASWLMMKRGAKVIFVHFHSYPMTDRASIDNVQELVKILTKYQFDSKLYLVSFLEIQKAIMAKAPAKLRVLLYRRYMVRISERIAREERALGLVTGESLGQVASQTLENMRATEAVSGLPIYRPLVSFDKTEIIDLSRKIGTYAISSLPYGDCCSLFVPAHPETRARLSDLESAEVSGKFDELMDSVMQKIEIKKFEF